MFGHPAAFVNGNMFFGTFNNQLVFRISGVDAAAPLASGAVGFEPMEGRAWKDYVALEADTEVSDANLMAWAQLALNRTATLAAKVPKARKAKA
jgi:TfoX/Sxy family transcriptional regulator of competence genes